MQNLHILPYQISCGSVKIAEHVGQARVAILFGDSPVTVAVAGVRDGSIGSESELTICMPVLQCPHVKLQPIGNVSTVGIVASFRNSCFGILNRRRNCWLRLMNRPME